MIIVVLAVFFASGFAALLYQVIWQRVLGIFSGADVYAATLIVAAFMAGIGFGSLAGGHLADRVTRRTSLILFGVAEIAIAGFGYYSTTLYYDVLYQRFGDLPTPPVVLSVILFVSLLGPTLLMGASLPLLARAMTDRVERAGFTIGALYGCNTLGAATGALVATWLLIPRFGLEGTVFLGALVNVACAAAVLLLAARTKPDFVAAHTGDAGAVGLAHAATDRTLWVWASIYAFSGFLALSLEITWFRLLGVMLKATAFTFGTMLAAYLAGLGLGSLAGAGLARRIRRLPAAFLALQSAGALTAGCILTIVIALSDNAAWLREYFAGYEALDVRAGVTSLRNGEVPALFLLLYGATPALLVVPATFLFGCSFPVLQQLVQTDPSRVGRRVGLLLLANIAGSMVGTVLTGFVALNMLGTAETLRVLIAMSALFPVLGYFLHRRAQTEENLGRVGLAVSAATALLLVAVAWSMPDAERLWSRLHGTSAQRIIVGEDGSGVSVVRTETSGRAVVFVNGIGQSTLPYGDIHTALGVLPAFVHVAPKDAVVIGLGSGDTCHAVAGRQELERVECVEIIRPQLETLVELNRRQPYGGLAALLTDRRIEHIFGDGRIHLKRGGRQYDIIEADALRPTSSYSGNLYSDAYFELMRQHLRPGGLAATWLPTERVLNGFVRVFPYVVSVPGVLLGSSNPIAFDREVIMARVSEPAVRDYYLRAGIDIQTLIAPFLDNPARYGPDFPRHTLTDFNTDLFPKDEFDLGFGVR